jgi:hypothetical protein
MAIDPLHTWCFQLLFSRSHFLVPQRVHLHSQAEYVFPHKTHLRCPEPRSPVIFMARKPPAGEALTRSFHKTTGAGGSLSGKSGSFRA